MPLSFQKLFYAILTVFALFTVLILAKVVLIPLAFALLISFILFPLVQKFEQWGANKTIASICAMVTLVTIIVGSITLFSTQIFEMLDNITAFRDKILQVFAEATIFINGNIPMVAPLESGELLEN